MISIIKKAAIDSEAALRISQPLHRFLISTAANDSFRGHDSNCIMRSQWIKYCCDARSTQRSHPLRAASGSKFNPFAPNQPLSVQSAWNLGTSTLFKLTHTVDSRSAWVIFLEKRHHVSVVACVFAHRQAHSSSAIALRRSWASKTPQETYSCAVWEWSTWREHSAVNILDYRGKTEAAGGQRGILLIGHSLIFQVD